MRRRRYPKIYIRSQSDLANQISDPRFANSKKRSLKLIGDVRKNFNSYWRDHPTQSKDGKWVRDASGTKLGKLISLINENVFSKYDNLLPAFIFGGISERNIKQAAAYLNGEFKKQRTLLKIDARRFFEQIHDSRVEQFLAGKCGCSKKGAKLLSQLCCIPYGPKDNPANYKTIARGFATSSRLAVWCNLDTFINLERLVRKYFRGKEPRIAVYVDDIGITASKASKEEMLRLYDKIKKEFLQDHNQKLPLNEEKTRIIFHNGTAYDKDGKLLPKKEWGFEHLGIRIGRSTLTLGKKPWGRLRDINTEWKDDKSKSESTKNRRKALLRYKGYIERRAIPIFEKQTSARA